MVVLGTRHRDDDKSKNARAAIDKTRLLLADEAFTRTLQQEEAQEIAIRLIEADGALQRYRAAGGASGPMGAMGHTTTGNPVAVVVVLIAAAAGLVLVGHGKQQQAGRDLDRVLEKLGELLEKVAKRTPPAATLPANLGPAVTLLKAVGVTLTGAVLMAKLNDIKEAVRTTTEAVDNLLKVPRGPTNCADAISRFRTATQNLTDMLNNPGQGAQFRIIPALEAWKAAVDAVLICLGEPTFFS